MWLGFLAALLRFSASAPVAVALRSRDELWSEGCGSSLGLRPRAPTEGCGQRIQLGLGAACGARKPAAAALFTKPAQAPRKRSCEVVVVGRNLSRDATSEPWW